MHKYRWLYFCGMLVIGILIMIHIYEPKKFTEAKTQVMEQSKKSQIASIENAVVLYNTGKRGSYSSYDATDSLVFFAYTEQTACVDAYNYSGEFQFSISLAHRDRGSVDIRCHDNLLFIDSKYGNVFIFDEDKCIEKLSADIADSKGYTSAWFQKRTIPLRMGLVKIYRYDGSGDVASKIVMPSTIFWNNCYQYLLFCVVISCFVARFIWNRRKVRK